MVSRSNQDEICKLYTDPQLSEATIIYKNSKEHTSKKVNQKELPLLKKYFSSFIKTETKLNKKYLKTKR